MKNNIACWGRRGEGEGEGEGERERRRRGGRVRGARKEVGAWYIFKIIFIALFFSLVFIPFFFFFFLVWKDSHEMGLFPGPEGYH